MGFTSYKQKKEKKTTANAPTTQAKKTAKVLCFWGGGIGLLFTQPFWQRRRKLEKKAQKIP